jgi:hypothetical protein
MKKIPSKGSTCPLVTASPRKLRALNKCLRELRALYIEATTILDDLLIGPSADIVRGLCARFRILQEHFAARYHEARALAISALGSVKAALSFPNF